MSTWSCVAGLTLLIFFFTILRYIFMLNSKTIYINWSKKLKYIKHMMSIFIKIGKCVHFKGRYQQEN